MIDSDRYHDPLRDLADYDEYDARLGQMNGLGRSKSVERYTRKTLASLDQSRPVIDRQAADIRQPSLDEGVTFVSRMCDKDNGYV